MNALEDSLYIFNEIRERLRPDFRIQVILGADDWLYYTLYAYKKPKFLFERKESYTQIRNDGAKIDENIHDWAKSVAKDLKGFCIE